MKSVRACPAAPQHMSHPSRGAWIEIIYVSIGFKFPMVAPLAGCVD